MTEKRHVATTTEARRERVRQTDEISKAILSDEAATRAAKTERLRAMRLAASSNQNGRR